MRISFAYLNDLYYNLKDADTRFIVNYGGAGSGKSWSQSQYEIYKALTSKQKILVVRKVATTLNDSVVSLLMSFIKNIPDYEFNKVEKHFYLPNGSEILCKGMDDPEKIKSIAGITRIWIEEASELDEDDFNQLNLRLRGSKDLQMSLTFNPIHEEHWLKKRFFDVEHKDATVFKTTYLDNKFIDEAYKEQLESYKEIDANYYKVYALGEWGKTSVKNPFAMQFDETKHVKAYEIDKSLPIQLSFDFNVNPATCTLSQQDRACTWKRFLYEFRIGTKENKADIWTLCDHIKTVIPQNCYIEVTGDATGRSGSLYTKGSQMYYDIIEEELMLTRYQIHTPSKNPTHEKSHAFVNKVFRTFDVSVHPRMKHTINDLNYVEYMNKSILKREAEKNGMGHLLDCVRYDLHTFIPVEFID